MKQYSITIKFIADYLQDRFSVKSQENLTKVGRKTVSEGIGFDPNSWKDALYKDEKGCYLPAVQIKGALVNSGRDFKIKARRTSFKDWVRANLFVDEEKIYLGKEEPDEIKESYVKRKDGSRVPKLHPSFNAGLQISFTLNCMDDNIEDDLIQKICENAGKGYGVGARRPEYGRFEVVEFKKI